MSVKKERHIVDRSSKGVPQRIFIAVFRDFFQRNRRQIRPIQRRIVFGLIGFVALDWILFRRWVLLFGAGTVFGFFVEDGSGTGREAEEGGSRSSGLGAAFLLVPRRGGCQGTGRDATSVLCELAGEEHGGACVVESCREL